MNFRDWQKAETRFMLSPMSDPLSLVPMAIAAGGGQADRFDAGQLVAAGVTLLQRSASLVRALDGRRSAILLPTSPAFLTALAASDGRGAVLINPLAARPEIDWQIRDSGVGAVFTNSVLAPMLPEDVARVLLDDSPARAQVITPGRSHEVDLGSHFGLPIEGELGVEGSREELAVIYTSAMQSIPRGARITHRNVLSNAMAVIQAAAITPDDHSLVALPFAHMFGLVVAAVAPLLAGAHVTTMERFHPAQALQCIEEDGVTIISGVPAMYYAMLHLIEKRGTPLSGHRLRVCIVGGSPLDPLLQDRWSELTGVEMRQGFGLTEAGPVCTFNSVDSPNRRGSLGTPFPGVEVAIFDLYSDTPLGTGETGEICVRGPNVFAGYVNEATDGLTMTDGWLRTGDLGWKRPDGAFFFSGVRKRMFTRNGFNIYPAELERVVMAAPGVSEATVTAVPYPTRDNNIRLTFAGETSEEKVREWCRENLAAYKQPSEILKLVR